MWVLYHESCKGPGEYFYNQSREVLVEKAVALWAGTGYFGDRNVAENIIRNSFAGMSGKLSWPGDEDFPALIFWAEEVV
jgi:hypothetical protein